MSDWSTSAVDLAPDPAVPSGLPAVVRAVEAAEAVGFVHVGGRDDADRRYLTRTDAPDREAGVVVVPGDDSRPPTASYCIPSDIDRPVDPFDHPRDDGIRRVVKQCDPSAAIGRHVRNVLADQLATADTDDGTVLVPRTVPHDTAVFLQQAGYELRSTAVLTTARATKSAAERDQLRAVQTAAAVGMTRAEVALAASEPTDEGLWYDGRPLTAERCRRLVDAELASVGVSSARNTRVDADAEPTAPLPAGEPIGLTVAPRGPQGYRGRLRRTVVVGGDGGWERRAFVAAEAGLRAVRHHANVGVDVSTVRAEAVAEVGAYGFAVAPDNATNPAATATIHGIGLSSYESPAPGTESELDADSVIVAEVGVDDPTRGAVRLGSVFVVTADGTEQLVEYPASMTPVDRLDDSTPY